MATIQEVYIALFGRPADPVGYNFYVEATNDGANLDAVGSLANSPEYLERFEGQSDIDMVNQIYMDLFGRPADAEGLLFYVAQLQSGEASLQDIAIRILDGATGTDAEIIENKVEAAQLFTDSLDTAAEITAYQGERAADLGREFLNDVTGDDATVPTQEEVDASIDAVEAEAANPTVPGNTFTLTAAGNAQTAGIDEVEGTANNDTFRAITAASLNSEDIIDGGAGNDVLTISAGGYAAGAAPVINSVETINNAEAASLNLTNATGVERVNSSAGVANAYTGASLATTFAATVTASTITIAYAGDISGDGTTVNLATDIDNAAGQATFEFGLPAVAGEIENVNIDVNGDDNDDTLVVIDADATNIETITFTGNGDTTFNTIAAQDAITEVDASALTGNLDISIDDAAVDLASVVSGSGSDTITVALGDVDLTVNSGAGADTVELDAANAVDADDASSATITLGAGNDTFVLVAGGNVADDAETQAQLEASLVTITDFVRGTDTIELGGNFGAFAAQGGADGVTATIGDADTVAEAVEAIRASGIADAQFNLNGNLYLFNDAGANDTLIELTGVTTLLTDADYNL